MGSAIELACLADLPRRLEDQAGLAVDGSRVLLEFESGVELVQASSQVNLVLTADVNPS